LSARIPNDIGTSAPVPTYENPLDSVAGDASTDAFSNVDADILIVLFSGPGPTIVLFSNVTFIGLMGGQANDKNAQVVSANVLPTKRTLTSGGPSSKVDSNNGVGAFRARMLSRKTVERAVLHNGALLRKIYPPDRQKPTKCSARRSPSNVNPAP